MKILVTNDDGIKAEGLVAMAEALEPRHEVWRFAPDRERSGISHAITLASPGRIQRLSDREYSFSGTPCDCVVFACLGALPFKPDLVIAGINRGPNLGTDIIYSGTCGAARQAAMSGLPAIAVSCAAFRDKLRYGAAAAFVARHLDALLGFCEPNVFLNINAPDSSAEDLPAVWSSPCRRLYRDELASFKGPHGFSYCFLTGGRVETVEEEGSDQSVVASGRIALSPILVHPQLPAGFSSGRQFG